MALPIGAKFALGLGAVGLGAMVYGLTRKKPAPGPQQTGAAPTFEANGSVQADSSCPGGKMAVPLASGGYYCPKGQPAGTFVPKERDCESGHGTFNAAKHGYVCT